MVCNVFCWYDKVDKVYMKDSIVADRSTRAVCRGYLQAFEQNRKMNFKEFSLVQLGSFDDETGILIPFDPPKEIDPTIVFEKQDLSDGKEKEL